MQKLMCEVLFQCLNFGHDRLIIITNYELQRERLPVISLLSLNIGEWSIYI